MLCDGTYKHIVPTGLKSDNLNNHAILEAFTKPHTFSKIDAYGAIRILHLP